MLNYTPEFDNYLQDAKFRLNNQNHSSIGFCVEASTQIGWYSDSTQINMCSFQ